MPFRSDQFDFACSHMVLALVTDPLVAVKEVARVLRPGGTFRIFTPAYWRLGDTERSAAFRDVSDTLTRLAPSVRDRGVGNDAFRERSSIENVLKEAFGPDSECQFEASDFEIDLEPEDALQVFSLGMYQFFLIPDEEKGRVLHLLFDKLRTYEGPDSLVHLTRPMEVITVRKSRG
jgi:SAM-dependent methyltransferase